MHHFMLAAHKFCRFILANPDPDPSHAVFAVTESAKIHRGELLTRWRSESAGVGEADINEEDVAMRFKLDLLRRSGSVIGRSHARRFFHYLEQAEFIEIERKLSDYVRWGKAEDGISIGQAEGDTHEGRVSIMLTNKGVDFANRSAIQIFATESSLIIAAVAVIISLFGLFFD